MSEHLRADVIFESLTGLAEDRYVNRFHFFAEDGSAGVGEAAVIAATLPNFYNTAPAEQPGTEVGQFLSDMVSRVANASQIKVYDAEEGGSPIASSTFTLVPAASSAVSLPMEVAACLSYRADFTSVPEFDPEPPEGPVGDLRPRSRRRNRLYIGPLNITAGDATGRRPATAFNDCLRHKGRDTDLEFQIAGQVRWMVWSDTEQEGRNIVAFATDDAWDTQRRRGLGPTARTELAV